MTGPSGGEDRVTLIVDDDVSFCSALAGALRRRGEKVIVAHHAREALVEARAWRPERATVDLRLHEESGLPLIGALRSILPHIEIVMLTGFGSISTAVEAVKAGAVHYLTKPVSVSEILQAFDGELRGAEVEPPPSLDEVEREHLQRVLAQCAGNISEAARTLGLHRRTLQRKLSRYRPRS